MVRGGPIPKNPSTRRLSHGSHWAATLFRSRWTCLLRSPCICIYFSRQALRSNFSISITLHIYSSSSLSIHFMPLFSRRMFLHFLQPSVFFFPFHSSRIYTYIYSFFLLLLPRLLAVLKRVPTKPILFYHTHPSQTHANPNHFIRFPKVFSGLHSG